MWKHPNTDTCKGSIYGEHDVEESLEQMENQAHQEGSMLQEKTGHCGEPKGWVFILFFATCWLCYLGKVLNVYEFQFPISKSFV